VPQPAPERRHVFISYSHADRAWVERLKRMMAPLLRGSGQELRLWDDSRIEAGMKWREEIETALAEAKVALLLVSDAFLASEFVMGQEVPELLAAAEAEGVTVLWVSLSPSFVDETEIHSYQAVLPPHRHLEAMAEVEWKEALRTVGLAIRKALRQPLAVAGAGPGAPASQASPSQAGVAAAASQPAVVATPAESRPVMPQPGSPQATARPPQAPAASPQPLDLPQALRPAQLASHALPTETHDLETARLRRQGEGWRLERRSLRVERALLPLGEEISLPLLWIPGGELVMGSPPDELERCDSEGPQYRVRLAGFWLGQTPITQAQWRAVARLVPPLGERWQRQLPANPSYFQPDGEHSSSGYGRFSLLSGENNTDQRPVEQVSWHEAMEFCRRVETLLPDGSGLHCTLPSEAQWEYACRAGESTPFSCGETITPELANYDANDTYADGPKGEYRKQTTPVGMFPANAWGLHDMHGNVWEWCLDHWHDSYAKAPGDGSAWVDSKDENNPVNRLLRGGSWLDDPRYCRSADRNHDRPDNANYVVGFRVVCLPQDPSLNT
jgi:formylglycine-generating enzyme required for sulfatase activity